MAKPKMRRIRGEYRPFFEALFTGKDFAKLSPDAKLAYMFAKGLSGAAGIKVWPAFVEQLAELTGMPTPRTKRAVEELQTAAWLAVEGSVVWVIRGLDFEPQMVAGNVKHRAWLREHLDSLPRVSLVRRFTDENPDWFTESEDRVSDTLSDTLSHTLCDTNPNPNSLSQSLSLSQANNSSGVRAASGEHRTRLATAANNGIKALTGVEQPFPLRWDKPGTHECAERLEAAGVDLDFAERTIYRLASSKLPSDGKPPRSLKYYADAVIDAWQAEEAHRVAAVTPVPTATAAAVIDFEQLDTVSLAKQGNAEAQATCDERGWAWRVSA